MQRNGLIAITAVLAGAAAAAAPAAACDTARHGRAAHWPGPGRAPLVVGDSVLLGAVPEVAAAGFEVDARGCRTMAQGLELLRARRRGLPRLVVLALGTNATVTTGDVRRALAIVGPDRVLALVTPRELGGAGGADARVVRAAARRWPGRLRALDWVAYAAGRASWFSGQGIHLSAAGARGLARLLRRARDARVEVRWSGRRGAARRR